MKTLLLLFTVFLLFPSCCKDIPTPAFSAEELAWLPYKDGDTLKMKGSNGKQLWLRFYNKRTDTGKGYLEPPGSTFGQCPNSEYTTIGFNVIYVSNKLNFTVQDTSKFDSWVGTSYTITKISDGAFKFRLSSNYFFDLDRAIKIDTIINNEKKEIYSDTSTHWIPSNFYKITIYIIPEIGIIKLKKVGQNIVTYEKI